MLFEIVAICAPFILGIVLVGLGHDITDPRFTAEQEGEQNATL